MRAASCLSLVFSALLLCPMPASADGGSELQARIDSAQSGSTVNVEPGEYRLTSGLVIRNKKDLILRFDPKARVLVTDTNSHVVQISGSSNITVRGGYFSHHNPLEEYACHGDVFHVSESQKVAIHDADINGSGAVGIMARNVRGLQVEHCLIHENTFNALYLDSCDDVKIKANRIENNANTLQSYRLKGLDMADNIIQNNGGYWGNKDAHPGLPR